MSHINKLYLENQLKVSCSHCEGQQTWVKNGCSLDLEPVCSSNGKTYNNICSFQNEKCKQRGSITKLHEGPCATEGMFMYVFKTKVPPIRVTSGA